MSEMNIPKEIKGWGVFEREGNRLLPMPCGYPCGGFIVFPARHQAADYRADDLHLGREAPIKKVTVTIHA